MMYPETLLHIEDELNKLLIHLQYLDTSEAITTYITRPDSDNNYIEIYHDYISHHNDFGAEEDFETREQVIDYIERNFFELEEKEKRQIIDWKKDDE